jgi:hypothetical protein
MQESARKRTSILVAVLARVIVYGAAVLAVAICVLDFRSIISYQPAVQSSSAKFVPGGSDWPNLRGPRYDANSDETDLAESWPAEGPPVLWVRPIGRGYSGMIAVGNRVFVQAQTLTEQKVMALDADSGLTIWEYAYAWPYEAGGMYPGPRATPTWSAGKIYFASPDGVVECLDAADGRRIWLADVNQKFEGRGTDFGYSCSPLVEDGKVILPVGGPKASVVALNAETGETVWTSGGAPASYSSAIPIMFRGRRLAVAFLQNELAGFDLATGRLLWQQSYSHGYDEHSAYPLYREPYLRTAQPFRGGSDLYVLEAAAQQKGTEEVVGNNFSKSENVSRQPPPSPSTDAEFSCRLKLVRHDDKMSNDVASSVLVGDYLYGFDLFDVQTKPRRPSRGEFRCMDFKTGKILWSSDRTGQATIAAADKKLYLFNDRGEAILIRADPRGYQELARANVFPGEICWTAPCLHRSRLYLRSPTRAACLYVGKPERLDFGSRNAAVPTSAMAKAKWSDLSWLAGGEREFPFELPDLRELSRWYLFSMAAMLAAALFSVVAYGAVRRYCSRKPAGQTIMLATGRQECLPRLPMEADRSMKLARRIASATFLAISLAFGLIATPLGNRFSSEFVFTWPVALFCIQQFALAAVMRLRRPHHGNAAEWLGALGSLAMIFACLAYYELTRELSLVPGWYFLLAFLPSWPLAIPAAAQMVDRPVEIEKQGKQSTQSEPAKNNSTADQNLWGDIGWTLAAFSYYFWIGGGIILARGALRQ